MQPPKHQYSAVRGRNSGVYIILLILFGLCFLLQSSKWFITRSARMSTERRTASNGNNARYELGVETVGTNQRVVPSKGPRHLLGRHRPHRHLHRRRPRLTKGSHHYRHKHVRLHYRGHPSRSRRRSRKYMNHGKSHRRRPPFMNYFHLSDKQRIHRISVACGSLCNPDSMHMTKKGSNHPYRHVPISKGRCTNLFRASGIVHLGHHKRKAPRAIPMNIYYQFTMHGRIKVERKYLSEVIHDTRREWSYETIENYMDKVKTAKAIKGVPANELFHLLNRINVKHAKVLVIGAHTPWVEATALQAGARETHTVEAFHIKSDDKRMITYSYSQFAYYYLHKKLPQFDLVISYSMLEHIGLGRYGDALNPWGDVMTLAMAWCAAAPNAKLILQVPRAKTDKLLFNLHRYYGPKRLPFVTTNWAPITMGSDSESHMPLYGERARAQVYQRMA